MTEYKIDCPGCGRVCSLTLKESNGQYVLRGNTCNTGKHGAIENWDFLNEDNIIVEEKKKVIEKKSIIHRAMRIFVNK